jgi:hypothetical protein
LRNIPEKTGQESELTNVDTSKNRFAVHERPTFRTSIESSSLMQTTNAKACVAGWYDRREKNDWSEPIMGVA